MPVQWDDEPQVIWDDEVPASTPVLWDDEPAAPPNYFQQVSEEARHPSNPNKTPFFDRLAAGAARGFLGVGTTPEGPSVGFDETKPESFRDIPLEALKRAANNVVGMPADLAMDQLRNMGAEGKKFLSGEQGFARSAVQALPFLGQGIKAISEASGRGDYAGVLGASPAVIPSQAIYKSLAGKGAWKLLAKLGTKKLKQEMAEEMAPASARGVLRLQPKEIKEPLGVLAKVGKAPKETQGDLFGLERWQDDLADKLAGARSRGSMTPETGDMVPRQKPSASLEPAAEHFLSKLSDDPRQMAFALDDVAHAQTVKEVEPVWRSAALLPMNTAFGGPFDASALSRQLRLYTAGHPWKAVAMAKNMAWMQSDEKISKALFQKAERSIREDEFFPLAQKSGLAGFRDLPPGASKFAEHEAGVYINPLIENNTPEIVAGEFRRSARSNDYALKFARYDTFKRLAKEEQAAGRLTDDVGKALARDINNTSGFAVPQGKGPLATPGNAMINGMSGILTSARYTASRFMHPGVLARMASPGTPMSLKKELAQQYLGYVATRATIIGLAVASGWEFGTDPLSSEYMKLRHGDTVQDVFGGDAQAKRLTSRLWASVNPGEPTRRKNTGELVRESPGDVLVQFFSGLLHPAAGAVVNRLRSKAGGLATKDLYGKESDLGAAVAEGSTPAAFSMLAEMGRSKDAGFLDALSGIMGNNVMVYEAPKKLDAKGEKTSQNLFDTAEQKKVADAAVLKPKPEVKSLEQKLGAARKGLSKEQIDLELQGLLAQGKKREAIRRAYVWAYTDGRNKATGKPARLPDLDVLLRGLEDNE